MSNEVKPIAGAKDSSVENKSDNMSIGDMLHSRIAAKMPKVEEEPQATPEPEAELEAEPIPEESQEEEIPSDEPNEEAKDVPSKNIDLENMSEEELRELADKLGSRAVARYGELTAKRKAAEERLTALEAEMARRDAPNPLASNKVEKNPYADLATIEDLQAKAREVDEAIEWAEDVLDQNDHLSYDDVVVTIDGNEITKGKVKQVLRDSRKAAKTYLPAQLQEVQASQQRTVLEQQMEESARKELPWLDGDDNDTRKQYETLKQSPVLAKAVKAVPELKPYMNYMLAHASNSMYGRKEIPLTESKPAGQIKPPSSPNSRAAQTEQPEGRTSKAEKEVRASFEQSGSTEDFIRLRTAQLNKRKTL